MVQLKALSKALGAGYFRGKLSSFFGHLFIAVEFYYAGYFRGKLSSPLGQMRPVMHCR